MNRGTLSLSIIFLLVALVGGLVLVLDLSQRYVPKSASVGIPAVPMGDSLPPPTIDGAIADGEYGHSYRDEDVGMELHWSVIGDKLYIGLRSPGHGWLAVGFDPDGPMMRGADIVIGYVQDGQAFANDDYSDTQVSHKPDTDLGGTDDVAEVAGSEDEQGTTLEFVRPLDTGDSYDKPITPGEKFVMLAYAEEDNWTAYHAKRGTVQIDFFASGGE
jgi:hypothetical protein